MSLRLVLFVCLSWLSYLLYLLCRDCLFCLDLVRENIDETNLTAGGGGAPVGGTKLEIGIEAISVEDVDHEFVSQLRFVPVRVVICFFSCIGSASRQDDGIRNREGDYEV